MWSWFGNYGISAIVFAIEHCFSQKPKSQYIENPVTDGTKNESEKKLTEEEKMQMERERQYMILKVMKANFELSKM